MKLIEFTPIGRNWRGKWIGWRLSGLDVFIYKDNVYVEFFFEHDFGSFHFGVDIPPSNLFRTMNTKTFQRAIRAYYEQCVSDPLTGQPSLRSPTLMVKCIKTVTKWFVTQPKMRQLLSLTGV